MTELLQETGSVIYENTIKYLHDITETLPANADVLKSYYSSKFRILEERGNVYLPRNKNKAQSRCPRCCLNLSDGTPQYIVKPEEKLSKFARKVLKKVKRNDILTNFQSRYAKKLDKNPSPYNELVMTCSFCNKQVAHRLNKPAKPKKNKDLNKQIPTKKKKKKKDRFCGLQAEAVNSAQAKRTENTSVIDLTSPVRNKNNKTLNNVISKKKSKKEKKKNISKLNQILSENSDKKNTSGLSQFLHTLN